MRVMMVLICLALMGCSSQERLTEKKLIDSLDKNRYTLGLIYRDYNSEHNTHKYDSVKGGLVVIKISTKSKTYTSGLKTGWVLLSVDGVSLENDGANKFYKRLQSSELSDNLRFTVFNTVKVVDISLTREWRPKNAALVYPIESYTEVD